MKTKILVTVIVVLLAGMGVLGYLTYRNKTAEPAINESAQNEQASIESDGTNMSPSGAYIDLATYNSSRSSYANFKKVYFFHAPWCPICRAIDTEITANPSIIPENTVFIKTDFDDNIDLRQKYGVTYQYTFVQVDNNDEELKQWSATTLDKALAGVQ